MFDGFLPFFITISVYNLHNCSNEKDETNDDYEKIPDPDWESNLGSADLTC